MAHKVGSRKRHRNRGRTKQTPTSEIDRKYAGSGERVLTLKDLISPSRIRYSLPIRGAPKYIAMIDDAGWF